MERRPWLILCIRRGNRELNTQISLGEKKYLCYIWGRQADCKGREGRGGEAWTESMSNILKWGLSARIKDPSQVIALGLFALFRRVRKDSPSGWEGRGKHGNRGGGGRGWVVGPWCPWSVSVIACLDLLALLVSTSVTDEYRTKAPTITFSR